MTHPPHQMTSTPAMDDDAFVLSMSAWLEGALDLMSDAVQDYGRHNLRGKPKPDCQSGELARVGLMHVRANKFPLYSSQLGARARVRTSHDLAPGP